MQTLTYSITSVVLLVLAAWLLVKSHGRAGSFVRSLGYGALFTPLFLWFGFGRYIVPVPWQVFTFSLVAALFAALLIHLLRLPRRFGPDPEKGDLLDLAVDKLIDLVTTKR